MTGEAQINIHVNWVDDERDQLSHCQKSRKQAPKSVHQTGREECFVCFGG